MKWILICQEEPVFFNPALIRLLKETPESPVLMVIDGKKRKLPVRTAPVLRFPAALLLFGLPGMIEILFKSILLNGIRLLKLTGSRFDTLTLEGTAKRSRIPVIRTDNIHHPDCLLQIRLFEPDLIVSQSESIIRKELLSIPKYGVINRHGSILPRFRGRMASFYAHQAEPPVYGITIHRMNGNIDLGERILSETVPVDPAASYFKVLKTLMAHSPRLLIRAMDLMQSNSGDFEPIRPVPGEKPVPEPGLREILLYRRIKIKRLIDKLFNIKAGT